MSAEIEVALQQDLGYTLLNSTLQSQGLTGTEIKYTLENFFAWTKPAPINTPPMVGVGECYLKA